MLSAPETKRGTDENGIVKKEQNKGTRTEQNE